MVTHDYKVWPDFFEAIASRRKRFEWRRDDREPQPEVGDFLHLREWEPSEHAPFDEGRYTGRSLVAQVTYTLRGPAFGMPEGFVVMSLSEPTRYPRSL